jgi:hypothetical protein
MIVARLAPQPPVPTIVRQLSAAPALPLPSAPPPVAAQACAGPPAAIPPTPAPMLAPPEPRRAVVAPLTEATFKIQFTASLALHDKLREAQALLRHRLPSGDLGAVFESALDALLEKVKKERFAVGCNPRRVPPKDEAEPASRHVPNATKRDVYERDEGRCTFTDDRGRRCSERCVEFDHMDGFARTGIHHADRMRLLCRAHNQLAAEKLYGRDFMSRTRGARSIPSTCSETSPRESTSSNALAPTGAIGRGPAPPEAQLCSDHSLPR